MKSSLAFVFPGQGSQSVGMLSQLAEREPIVTETFADASAVLGLDLWRLVSDGPKEDLDQTQHTQPAMLAAGVAVWRCWVARGGARPSLMAGHSLGEYTALVCSDAIGFADAVRVVAERGRLMQQAVPAGTGAMAALLGLDDDSVRAICAQQAQGEVLEAVNFNAPGQVVVAGHRDAVERCAVAAKDAGAKRAVVLPVSVPSHCALMRGAAERLGERLAAMDIQLPDPPVLHNVTVEEAPSVDAIRSLLVRQLYSPVRWVETVQAFAERGIAQVVEAGPGKVLTGLGKRIDRNISALPVLDADTLDKALNEVSDA
jgi:[acyl-carrier-protein] S-malonyltransferase